MIADKGFSSHILKLICCAYRWLQTRVFFSYSESYFMWLQRIADRGFYSYILILICCAYRGWLLTGDFLLIFWIRFSVLTEDCWHRVFFSYSESDLLCIQMIADKGFSSHILKLICCAYRWLLTRGFLLIFWIWFSVLTDDCWQGFFFSYSEYDFMCLQRISERGFYSYILILICCAYRGWLLRGDFLLIFWIRFSVLTEDCWQRVFFSYSESDLLCIQMIADKGFSSHILNLIFCAYRWLLTGVFLLIFWIWFYALTEDFWEGVFFLYSESDLMCLKRIADRGFSYHILNPILCAYRGFLRGGYILIFWIWCCDYRWFMTGVFLLICWIWFAVITDYFWQEFFFSYSESGLLWL